MRQAMAAHLRILGWLSQQHQRQEEQQLVVWRIPGRQEQHLRARVAWMIPGKPWEQAP